MNGSTPSDSFLDARTPPLSEGEVHVWRSVPGEELLPSYVVAPQVTLTTTSLGKPRLADSNSGIEFSVTHSGGLELIAVARNRPVGIDVERVRADRNVERIAARMFAASEQAYIGSLRGRARLIGFYRLWTAREALAKGIGSGLALVPGDMVVDIEGDGDPVVSGIDNWSLRWLNLPEDYVGCVAARGERPSVIELTRTLRRN